MIYRLFSTFFKLLPQKKGNHGKLEHAEQLNKTVLGVDLGDGGRKALVEGGRQDRFATSGKGSLLRDWVL